MLPKNTTYTFIQAYMFISFQEIFPPTLDSEINVGLTFIILDFFPCTTALSKGPTFIKFSIKNQKNGILLPKLFCTTVRKKCSSY